MPESDVANPINWSELEDHHDRYDRVRAQPSDEDLRIMWIIYSVLLFVLSLGIMTVFLGILTNRQVRKNPFNKYLLFLSCPDFVYSFLCLFTCALSAIDDSYVSWEMCQFQVFYLYSAAAANSWINGVMAWEIYRLLKCSKIRMRYFPPTDRQVYRNCAICYFIALITGSLPLIADALNGEDYFPVPGIQSGFFCAPTELTLTSTLLFWFVMAPLVFVIPYVFAIYTFVDVVFYSKLLPPEGRRRGLSIYFFRIVAMFAFLWSPTFLFVFALRGVASPWWVFAFSLFGHTQGLVSALLTLYKEDIRGAVWDFVQNPCNSCLDPDNQYRPPKDYLVADESGRSLANLSYRPSLNVGLSFRTSCRTFRRQQREADIMGLPVQGPDFQFLDEKGPMHVNNGGVSSYMDKYAFESESHGSHLPSDTVEEGRPEQADEAQPPKLRNKKPASDCAVAKYEGEEGNKEEKEELEAVDSHMGKQ